MHDLVLLLMPFALHLVASVGFDTLLLTPLVALPFSCLLFPLAPLAALSFSWLPPLVAWACVGLPCLFVVLAGAGQRDCLARLLACIAGT